MSLVAFEEDDRGELSVESKEIAWKGGVKGEDALQLEAAGTDSSSWLSWAVLGSRTNGYRAQLLRLPFGGAAAEEIVTLPGSPTPALKLGVPSGDRPDSVIGLASTSAETIVSVYSMAAPGAPKLSSTFKIEAGRGAGASPSSVECNPHLPHLFSITMDSRLLLFDSRAPGGGSSGPARPTLSVEAHGHTTCHSYNPNVPHLIATGGRDGKARIWDIRSGEGAKEVWGGGHWVTSIAYHPTHDQLLLTASTDGQVLLHDIGSVSYAGGAISDSSGSESGGDEAAEEHRRPHTDALLATFDFFQDSVYRVAWARGSPWTFAGCSWGNPGAKVGGAEVPRNVKMSIMLGV